MQSTRTKLLPTPASPLAARAGAASPAGAKLAGQGWARQARLGLARLAAWGPLALLIAACGGPAPLAPLGLSSAAEALLIGRPELRQPLEQQLERLFGPVDQPRLAALSEAAGFDPSAPAAGSLAGPIAEALAQDNARRWAEFLKALENQPFAKLDWPSNAPPLSPALAAAAREDQPDWRARVRSELLAAYPALTDSARAYQRDCATCHGREGGGDGPNSAFQNPKPRDFRGGAFLHFNAQTRTRPDHGELLSVLFKGVSGTGMPSWKSRPSADLSGIADYVRFLALRGEVELGLVASLRAGTALDAELADQLYQKAWLHWRPSAELNLR